MIEPHNETEPKLKAVSGYQNNSGAPPKILLWGVIGLFILIVGGVFAVFLGFNEILTTSQQVRVMDEFPFMEAFLLREPTPQGGVLPTVDPNIASDNAAMDLLNLSVESATEEPEEETTAETESTAEPTDVSLVVATDTPLPSATPLPTNTPPPPTASPTSAPFAIGGGAEDSGSAEFVAETATIPSSHRMFGMVWDRQTWNNCGPATVTTTLTYFGWQENQDYAQSFLKPNREDKNVGPYELVGFVNEQSSIRAVARMGGDTEMLRTLIANEFPVIVERGLLFEGNEWLGHYEALVAYDDSAGIFYAYDTFLGFGENGEGVIWSYQDLDEDWRAFNRMFIVLYEPEEEALVRAILGDLWDEQSAAEVALEQALAEARENPQDGFAWHNVGTSLTELGRYQEAATAFDRARQVGMPWRMLWYQFGTFEAYFNVGRYDDVISLAQSNLNNAPELEESYYWRGRALAELGNTSEAASNFRTALNYNPLFEDAQIALDNL